MIFALIVISVTGCDENKILEEKPLDFLTPTNAYTTPDGIEQGIVGLYTGIRDKWTYQLISEQPYALYGLGTDVGYDGETPGGQRFLTNYKTSVTPEYNIINTWWRTLYNQIQRANMILRDIENIDEGLWRDVAQKNSYIAEARFFRAWCHRLAVTLWGDVPLVDYVVSDAKVDFIRNPKEDVYKLIEDDLLYASQNLPKPGDEKSPGRLTQGAALHLLTDVYLAQKKYQQAVESSTRVINDFGYHLMTERFGNQDDVFGSGDVYYDLFRYGNQNPPLNKESIWVIQFEPNQELGGGKHYWSGIYGPRLSNFGLAPDGKDAFDPRYTDTLGVQVARMRGTNLVYYGVWKDNWDNDIRNAPHNVKRDFYYNNPKSEYHLKKIDLSEFKPGTRNLLKDTTNYIFPFFMKGWQAVVQATISDPGRGGGGYTHTDFAMMRLAETYLLRAEAYLGLNDKENAAKDINVVRARAKAKPVMPEQVDIDYILDERIRELYLEEMRMIILLRMGKLVDRVKRYHDNPLLPGAGIEEHNNLWPIPQNQIDLNYGAEFKQNPGY
ncbi:MAG: RagB/SusD family nutrient uptake outer membrane protein [Fermentimonas sp.]